MRYVFLIILLVGFSNTHAGSSSVSLDLTKRHDLVAIVRIKSISTEYEEAVNVVVERVIYRYGEATNGAIPVEVVSGDQLILVGPSILPVLNDGVKRVESVSSTTCYRFKDYKVGMRLRLFANEIGKGFYKNSACRLTKIVDENT